MKTNDQRHYNRIALIFSMTIGLVLLGVSLTDLQGLKSQALENHRVQIRLLQNVLQIEEHNQPSGERDHLKALINGAITSKNIGVRLSQTTNKPIEVFNHGLGATPLPATLQLGPGQLDALNTGEVVHLSSGTFKDLLYSKTQIPGSNAYLLEVYSDFSPSRELWMRENLALCFLFLLLSATATGVAHLAAKTRKARDIENRQIEAARRFENERFRLATEGAKVGVWELHIDSQQVSWDRSMKRLYGLDQTTEIASLSDWKTLLIPDDKHKLDRLVEQALTSARPVEAQVAGVRQSDGRSCQMLIRAKLYLNSEGQPERLIGLNEDITARRLVEDTLRDAEERFRSSFESAAIGMAMINNQGIFIQVNKALCEITGYDNDELVNQSVDQVTHPQDTKTHVGLVTEVMQGKRDYYQIEKRYIRKDGKVIWVHVAGSAVRDPKGRVLYFISQIQDITERKKNEAMLIEREHFLRTLSECLPGLVSYWSIDLRCHFVNKNHERWTGLSVEKLRGIHLRTLLGDESFSSEHSYIEEALKGNRQRYETKRPRQDGGLSDMMVHLIPDILYGRIEGFFSISTNISELKSQQRQLERMNLVLQERTQQAEAASKAKGAFLANMSHEIRTPMHAIMGLLQVMEHTELNSQQRDYLKKIGSAADVLLNVLNDVLDVSRIEANKLVIQKSRFDLDELLVKTMDLFTYRAKEKGVRLFFTKDPLSPVSLIGDRLRVAQILNNLLSNALKFTEQGHIHLQVKQSDDGRLLQFSVKDSGIGMSREQCEQLFRPFSQVDESATRRYSGAGLGLSICKSLSELMGGSIWVESEVGHGSIFHITIENLEPCYQVSSHAAGLSDGEHVTSTNGETTDTSTATSSGKAPSSAEPAERNLLAGKRILVVDDHKLNRLVASAMISKWGAETRLATNGIEAVEACKKETFDVVLMDLQMPEMDGFQATATIQEMLGTRTPPIIAVTASATARDRENILNAGMCEHLIKPFKAEELNAMLIRFSTQQLPETK